MHRYGIRWKRKTHCLFLPSGHSPCVIHRMYGSVQCRSIQPAAPDSRNRTNHPLGPLPLRVTGYVCISSAGLIRQGIQSARSGYRCELTGYGIIQNPLRRRKFPLGTPPCHRPPTSQIGLFLLNGVHFRRFFSGPEIHVHRKSGEFRKNGTMRRFFSAYRARIEISSS